MDATGAARRENGSVMGADEVTCLVEVHGAILTLLSKSTGGAALGHHGSMEHEDVRKWVASYEKGSRSAGTTALPGLFTEEAS
jgi:hypothetical protein